MARPASADQQALEEPYGTQLPSRLLDALALVRLCCPRRADRYALGPIVGSKRAGGHRGCGRNGGLADLPRALRLAYEVDRLPQNFGSEIHRILYFDDEDQLQRMWIDFGHPGGQSWEENYSLDEAITKYRELKADVARRHRELECEEPKLERVEEEGRVILDRSYRPNRTVWACEYERGPTHLKVSMRRLGDTPGERFDVIFDARDKAAVTAYQNGHRLRRPE